MTKKDEAKKQPQESVEAEVMEASNGGDESLPAQTNAASVAAADDLDTGLDIDDEDLVIPRMSVVQPTSEEGTPGTFRLNLVGEEFTELDVAFLKQEKGRVLFSEDRSEGAICGSNDRIAPAERFIEQETAMAMNCAGCESKEWQGDNAPQCKETFNLLGFHIETGIPFWFMMKSTALRPTKNFLSAVAFQIQNNNKKKKLSSVLCDYQVHITLKEVKNAKGKFYVPVFGKITYLKDHPYREERDLYAQERVRFEDPKPESSKEDDSGDGQDGMPF